MALVTLLLAIAWAGTGYRYEPYVEALPKLSGDVPANDRSLKPLASRLARRDANGFRLRSLAGTSPDSLGSASTYGS